MLDEQQQAAVSAGPVDLFISAGAGSGKTRVLTSRFVDAILGEPPYRAHEPGEILTVTFTEKAAGELAERARRGLAAAGRRDLARRTGDAWISTIHGMCSRILRQHALEAGVDPHFRVLDEVEAGALQMMAIERAVGTCADPGAPALVDTYGYESVARALRRILSDVRSLGREVGDVAVFPDGRVSALLQSAADAYESLARDLESLRSVRTTEANAACARLLAAACSCDISSAEARSELDTAVCAAKFSHARSVEGHEELVDHARAVLEEVRGALAQIKVREFERSFLALLDEYDSAYAEEKRARGALDFEDLQLATATLLERDPSVAARYRSRFAMVMLDEFQDTNELQVRIARLLSRENLCTVGDERQSIYAFRHADVEVFRRRRDEVAAHIELATNYRIEPRLLAALNGLFASPALFGSAYQPARPPRGAVPPNAAGGAGEPASLPVAGAAPDGAGDGPRMEIAFLDWSDAKGRDAHAAEAERIAECVAQMIAEGAAPQDIAVLMAAMSSGRGECVEAALIARGIPVHLNSGGAYFTRPEVGAVRALLRVIDNLRDEEALVTVLAGDLGGVSPEALLALRQHADTVRESTGKRPGLWDGCVSGDCRLPEPDRIAVDRLLAAVGWARRERGRLPLAEVLRQTLLLLDADLVCLARGRGGERAWGNMRKLIRLAADYEGVAQDGIRGFLRYLDQRELHSVSETEASTGSEATSVRVMSIHAAKGLEFGHVVVGGLERAGRDDSRIIVGMVDGHPLLGLRAVDEEGTWTPSAAFVAVRDARASISAEEDKRLLYVAMTRPERRLTVVVRTDPTKDAPRTLGGIVRSALGMGAADSIEEGVHSLGEGQVSVSLVGPTPDSGSGPAPVIHQATGQLWSVEVGQAITSTQATSMISRISYSGLREYEQCPYRYYLTRIERLAARPEPVTGTAAALGTAVHAVLERADQVDSIDDLCVKVARTFGLAGPDIKRLRDAVRAFESMAVRGRLRDADRVMREAPILVPVAGVVLSGAIDVIAWSGNRALVVDYKTGAGHSGEDAARSAYQLQAECYALAALSAGAEQVEVVIAETGPGRETSYHYGTDDRFAIEATIGAFVERMRVGEYEPRASYDPHLCERCPGFNASCAVRP